MLSNEFVRYTLFSSIPAIISLFAGGFINEKYFSEVDELKKEVGTLQYENNGLKPQIGNCRSELKDLKTNNRITYNQNIALIKTEKQELITNNNKYKNDIFILKNNLLNTEQELSKIKEYKNKIELEVKNSQLLVNKSLDKNKKLLSKIKNLNKDINIKNNEISKLYKKLKNNESKALNNTNSNEKKLTISDILEYKPFFFSKTEKKLTKQEQDRIKYLYYYDKAIEHDNLAKDFDKKMAKAIAYELRTEDYKKNNETINEIIYRKYTVIAVNTLANLDLAIKYYNDALKVARKDERVRIKKEIINLNKSIKN